MVIYKTQQEDKVLMMKAIESRDAYKPYLRGVLCHVCSKDTIISWDKDMTLTIDACCEPFRQKILMSIRKKK